MKEQILFQALEEIRDMPRGEEDLGKVYHRLVGIARKALADYHTQEPLADGRDRELSDFRNSIAETTKVIQAQTEKLTKLCPVISDEQIEALAEKEYELATPEWFGNGVKSKFITAFIKGYKAANPLHKDEINKADRLIFPKNDFWFDTDGDEIILIRRDATPVNKRT